MIKIIGPYLIFLENKYLNKNISLLQHRIDYNAAEVNLTWTLVTNGNNLIATSWDIAGPASYPQDCAYPDHLVATLQVGFHIFELVLTLSWGNTSPIG